MRILILADNLWAGGKERMLLELIKGFTVYPDVELNLVIFSDRVHFKEIYELGIPITILKREPKWNPLVSYRLLKVCKAWKPDLVYSSSSMSTIFMIPASILLNLKIVNGNIQDAPNAMKIYDKRLVRAWITFPFSKVILGNSYAGLNAYNVPTRKRVCIYNGFDINRIKNLEDKQLIRDRFQIKTTRVIGMVGSFNGNKDYQTYIDAAKLLFEKRDDVTFIAVGDGKDRSKYEQMIPEEFISRFIFTGVQTNVESIINIFDIGVLSTYTEGIANVLLEYMALNKPAIATNGGGTVETIVEGETGFLIPPASPKQLAIKLDYLLENESVLKKMGATGRQRLENVFGIEKMMKAHYKLFKGNL